MIEIKNNKNSYGKRTYQINLGYDLKLEIIEADLNSIIVNLIEVKIFRDAVIFSFISKENLLETSKMSIERAYEYIKTRPDYSWTEIQKNNKLNDVIFIIENNNL